MTSSSEDKTQGFPTRTELLATIGKFCWDFGQSFFIETRHGNFIWSDPDYLGDNTIRPFVGSYDAWCDHVAVQFGRDKGQHIIERYCGSDVKYLPEEPIIPSNTEAGRMRPAS